MAKRFTLSSLRDIALSEGEFARRMALAREGISPDQEAGKPDLKRILGELDILAEPARRIVRRLDIKPSNNPRTVLVLPGFAAHPRKMRYLAEQIERAGHTAKRWGQGRNWGPTPERFQQIEERLLEVHQDAGRPIVLLGWSLGGVYARELAHRHPEAVAKVITMGSPFSGSPRANNVWRVYQFITGHQVDAPPVEADFSAKPPVETVALWSPSDSAIAPRCAAGTPEERDRAVAVRCSHLGFTYSPEVISAVLEELERG